MRSRYSIIPWVPWSTYFYPQLLESHLSCHLSSWPLRDIIVYFQREVTVAEWGPGRKHLQIFIWMKGTTIGWGHGRTHLCNFRMHSRLGSQGNKLHSFWRHWVRAEGRTLEETTPQFWMLREVGICVRCTIPIGKGKYWGLRMWSAQFRKVGWG